MSQLKSSEYSKTGEAKIAWQNIAKEIDQNGSKLNKIWNSGNPQAL